VDQVDLFIPEGSVFGIIGKSGAGKSTLLRVMSLLEPPDQGVVYYRDERVDALKGKELLARRRRMGMIFQNFNLLSSRNVAGNIAYPLEIAGQRKKQIQERVDELLELVDIRDKRKARLRELSGGQKQRVAIARALAANPEVLFCDEATSALDPQTTRSILSLIRELRDKLNLTVVLITHQMAVIRAICGKVAVMEGGRVVEQGTVAALFTHPKTAAAKELIHVQS
jgi:D-methionine transport system ATP-binding protein